MVRSVTEREHGTADVQVDEGVGTPDLVTDLSDVLGTPDLHVQQDVAGTADRTVDGIVAESDGGDTPFTPLSIGWHSAFWAEDPDWNDPGDGGLVETWRNAGDVGGDATQPTETERPTYRDSVAAYNGQPALQFVSAEGQHMTTPTFTAVAQPTTVVAVANIEANLDGPFGTPTSNEHDLFRAGTFALRMRAGANLDTPDGVTDVDPHLFVCHFDGASSSLEQDGTVLVSGSAGTDPIDGICLGAATPAGLHLEGHVAFYGLYDGELSDSDKSDLETWAADHYGLTV